MAVTLMHLVARLQHLSGLPRDVVEMTTNVRFPDEPTLLERVDTVAAYIDFFNEIPTAGVEFAAQYISESMSRTAGASQILAYETTDLSGATPFGSPSASSNFTLGAVGGAGSGLPEEVCVVLSYNADLTDIPVSVTDPGPPVVTTRPQARRRGRLYFGPLWDAASFETAGVVRPIGGLRNVLGWAMTDYCNAVEAATTGQVVVWSKADAAGYPVVEGYVDDAWDTQRRRGPDPTARTIFTV